MRGPPPGPRSYSSASGRTDHQLNSDDLCHLLQAHRQLQPGPAVGDLGGVPPPGAARPDHVRPDDRRLWIYIGTQGILQGTYETFAAIAAKRFGGSLAGTITLTAGLGGMGGAQPLAVTMNGGVVICVECDQSRITRRIEHGYLDEQAADIDDAIRRAVTAKNKSEPKSIGLLGNAADVFPALLTSNAPIDIVTDQTSAHDPLTYLPRGVAFEDMAALRAEDPEGFTRRAPRVDGRPRRRHGRLPRRRGGGVRLRQLDPRRGPAGRYERVFDFPGFVPAYIRPLFCEGKSPSLGGAVSNERTKNRA